ncbi:ATP-grasp domain-containing protein [Marinobacter sp. JSM 1782161]|uniref:ATP-grasp domain-containing protein n=1 Tax=Marinobacter sp. JSM 1782161 TaxID=2685906 RepID=UPI0014024F46|nr:ATP-grasp domain-containing protein [Marinobacter sp. JSM 1782161]
MADAIIFISQSYLQFATRQTLEMISDLTETVLILHDSETVDPFLKPFIKAVHHVPGSLNLSLRPALSHNEVKALVSGYADRHGGPDRIRIFCQQEDNVELAALIREELGIPGDRPGLVSAFRNKLVMKDRVSQHRPEALPAYAPFNQELCRADPARYFELLHTHFGDKFVIKPTSAAGSFNVSIVESFDDFLHAWTLINEESHDFEYEVNEFIDGKMYQCDSLVIDGKVYFSGILELGCSNFDFVQGKPLSVYPVTSQTLYDRLFAFNQDIISALGFANGSTHHEIFQKSDGSLIFLEIAARVPGGLGVPYHAANSSINLIDANLLLAIGRDIPRTIVPDMRNNVISALLPVGNGTIRALNSPDIASRFTIDWYVKEGMEVTSRSLVDSAGVLMAFNDNPDILRSDFEKLQQYVPVTCS